jgi:site-specific DNA-methyltransferase (adenine-specific)
MSNDTFQLSPPRVAQVGVRVDQPQRERKHARDVKSQIVFGDNLAYLRTLRGGSIDLIYIDPPFNTGRVQARKQLRTVRDDTSPDRIGFKGHGYRTQVLGEKAFDDVFEDFTSFIVPRLEEAHRVLKPNGSLFLHIDYREVHYCKVYLDQIFGRASFVNEIIWAYDYGARSKRRWSAKHDNILWYAKNPEDYTFNFDDIDRIPYMAPGLVGPEKAARGKTPTDTWWHTIVSPTGKEKTGYPTQKPLGVVERIIRLHSRPDDTVLDFFAGSGTVGEACAKLGRNFILVDSNPEAIEVMKRRLLRFEPEIRSVPQPAKIPATTVHSHGEVHVLATVVWDYEDQAFPRLRGPAKDLEMVRQLFSGASPLGVYADDQIDILTNPTIEQLRSTIVHYAMDRSAKGDILIFYFSGHGTVLAKNEFGLCLKDTKIRPDGGGCLPLSVLSFDDIIRTLTAADVHPVFIIDACFSGKAGQNEQNKVVEAMHDDVHRVAASSYGLLCACYGEALAHDTKDGGAFTKALYDIAKTGLADDAHRQKQFLQLSDFSRPIQQRLTSGGYPLPKLYLGPDLPDFPLVRNVGYQPRSETLMKYHRKTLELLWNGGKERPVTLTEILNKLGQSAYGNHSKLSLAPWLLVKDGEDTKHRCLTDRGRQFMLGKLKVPETIEKDAKGEWHAADYGRKIGLADIGVPKAGRTARKPRR